MRQRKLASVRITESKIGQTIREQLPMVINVAELPTIIGKMKSEEGIGLNRLGSSALSHLNLSVQLYTITDVHNSVFSHRTCTLCVIRVDDYETETIANPYGGPPETKSTIRGMCQEHYVRSEIVISQPHKVRIEIS